MLFLSKDKLVLYGSSNIVCYLTLSCSVTRKEPIKQILGDLFMRHQKIHTSVYCFARRVAKLQERANFIINNGVRAFAPAV